MTIECSAFVATSLDGFIARKNGDLDWLAGRAAREGGEDYGYEAFMASVDAVVMGRKTYDFVSTVPEWPYRGKRVVVLSSRFSKDPRNLSEGVEGISCSPRELIQRLSVDGARHVYVDGGRTIQGFLNSSLIQKMTITRIPILIGDGIPLFGPLDSDVDLQRIETETYLSGFVQSTYRVMPAASATGVG